jgi:signal transduction histidine kinase
MTEQPLLLGGRNNNEIQLNPDIQCDDMSNQIAERIKQEFKRLNVTVLAVAAVVLLLNGGVTWLIYRLLLDSTLVEWLPALGISVFSLALLTAVFYYVLDQYSVRIRRRTVKLVDDELRQMRITTNHSHALQSMASVMRATLSFERVVEEALDVCSQALEELGVARKSLVGAVFLYNGDQLIPVATRRFSQNDLAKNLNGDVGIVGKALKEAEITMIENPQRDPGLQQFIAFHPVKTGVCIPLRAGFQIFGAILIGSETSFSPENEHFALFGAVADQAVIALQNAQLYQRLEMEKQRIIEADEEARKELARDLHDGPTQTIAAIAMRVNFIRTLVQRDPAQALVELEKVEDLAKTTSKDIRGMLFTLRPLVLETQGLAAAVETVIKRLKETDNLNIKLVGADNAGLLNDSAQSVVFSIVEEALGNARKYSKANLIEIRFWQEENLFVAQVRDDGVGFDTDAVTRNYSSRGSLGMVNMQERAERIDGTLRLESQPNKGTKVILIVPLSKHGSHL